MSIKKAYTKHWVIYYLKSHYKLNYIKYFWYDRKSWIKKNYKYNIKRLRKDIFKVLA